MVFSSFERGGLRRDLIDVFSYLMEGYREGTDRVFLKIYSNRTGSDEYKLEQKKFSLDIMKRIFHHEGGQNLGQVCREVVKYLSLQIFIL